MNSFDRLGRMSGLALAVAGSLAFTSTAAKAATMYMSAVAETFAPDAASLVPSQGKAVSYVAADGGLVVAGDPVAGDPAPAPALVEDAVARALASRGYQPATAGTAPAVLIVYNWGVIRPDSIQIHPLDRLNPNERARLLLVAPRKDADRIERDIVNDRLSPPGLRISAMTRTEPDRETLSLARNSHYFIEVSAYDVAALRQQQEKLVWRVKLTTQTEGRSMTEGIVGLLANGARFFGQNLPDRQDLREPAVAVPPAPSSPAPALNVIPEGVNPGYVRQVVVSDHNEFSGQPGDTTKK